MKIEISTENFFKQTGILNITLTTQDENDKELYKEAESLEKPVRINEIILGPIKDGKKRICISITIGKNK